MHWNHGKDAKPQSGKINCTVLIGLTQVGKAALPEAKEECRAEGKRIYFFLPTRMKTHISISEMKNLQCSDNIEI